MNECFIMLLHFSFHVYSYIYLLTFLYCLSHCIIYYNHESLLCARIEKSSKANETAYIFMNVMIKYFLELQQFKKKI